jgi:hypothetical protein
VPLDSALKDGECAARRFKPQLCSVDSLLLQLDDFDTGSRRRDTAPPLQAFARHV